MYKLSVLAATIMLTAFPTVQARTITIISGTYGANCGAPGGNATPDLVQQCDGRDTCEYVPNRARIGGATRSCPGAVQADWRCSSTEFHTAMLSPEADMGSTLVLSCMEQNGPGH
jgi:hypothetical protein